MSLRKLIVVVPIAGILAGIGMGAAAIAGGAFGLVESGPDSPPAPSPVAAGPTGAGTPVEAFDEVILAATDRLSADEVIREKKRRAAEDAPAGDADGSDGEGGSDGEENPESGAQPKQRETSEPEPEPKPQPTAFKPWKKVVKVWKADSSAFCTGLNDLRTGAGKPAFASCREGSGSLDWAKTMAKKRVFKHDPSYSGSEVVGYSWKLQRILTGPNGFVNSASHMKVITAGGESAAAKVGCYWQRLKEQTTEDGPVETFEYIYCVGRFS